MARRPRPDAKLKRLPWEEQLELWRLRFPEDGSQAKTQAEMRAEIPLRHGFTVSAGSFSEWERWFALELEFQEAAAQADQFAEQLLANPDLDPEKVKQAAQIIFTARSVKNDDGKLFTRLAALDLRKEDQQLRRDQFEEMKAAKEAAERKAEEARKSLKDRKAAGGLSDESLELIERTLGML